MGRWQGLNLRAKRANGGEQENGNIETISISNPFLGDESWCHIVPQPLASSCATCHYYGRMLNSKDRL